MIFRFKHLSRGILVYSDSKSKQTNFLFNQNHINTLHASVIQIINSTSKTINDIINKKLNKNENKNKNPTTVYLIRCAICNKSYIRETSRPLKKRINEHKQAHLKNDTRYALVLQRNTEKHNFDL